MKQGGEKPMKRALHRAHSESIEINKFDTAQNGALFRRSLSRWLQCRAPILLIPKIAHTRPQAHCVAYRDCALRLQRDSSARGICQDISLDYEIDKVEATLSRQSGHRLVAFIGQLFRLSALEYLFHLRAQTLLVGINWPDGEIPGGHSVRRVPHGLKAILQFEESAER